jgi:Cu-processing system ATP-binding protein
LGIRGRWF